MSPQTGGFFYLVMAPLWFIASKVIKRTLKSRQVPYLAFSASFVFIVMMFNIPLPGGSTGHIVGGTLVAALLGPWAALIAVTVALVVQALLFGDGGVTTIAVNCFNMAFVLPFTGYYIYKLISVKSGLSSMRRAVAAGLAAYFGLVIAAFFTGIEFGIQPLLHHTKEGQSLYCPYGLNIALPAMLIGHMALFAWVEAVVTFLVVRYLQKEDPSLIER